MRPTDRWLRRHFLGPRIEVPWLEVVLVAGALAMFFFNLWEKGG